MSGRGLPARLVVAVIAATMWTTGASAQNPPTLEQARALYDAGRLTEARALLVDLARTKSGDPDVLLLLGVIERTTGHLPEAIASLDRAHALAPGSAQVAVELATTLAWHGDLDRAVVLYEQVLEKDPSHLGARIGLGFARAWQGHLDRARALFTDVVGADPRNVDGWNGLGFVDRAALRRRAAEAAYRRTLAIDPKNQDATTALQELYWDRRTDVRVFGGGSTIPDGAWEPEARADVSYALSPGVTIGGGYQRYAFGAVLPIGGDPSAGTRSEDSFEAYATLRPSRRLTIGNSLYTFFSEGTKRGMFWEEGVFAITPRVSLVGVFRPAFSSSDPHWLFAGAVGTVVSVTENSRIGVKALIAADTAYEPRLTMLADYTASVSRRCQVQLSVANSSTDEQFAFTSVAATASWLFTPAVGVSVIANHRTQTFERSEILVGLRLRQ